MMPLERGRDPRPLHGPTPLGCRMGADLKPGDVNPNLVLPVGTRIVTRVEVKTDAARALRPVGAVAEIVAAPIDALHSYRVRFPDGAEASLRRREFSIWSRYREEAIAGPAGPDPLGDLSEHDA